MKTIILCMLFLVNNSILTGNLNKGKSPVSTLKIDAAQSRVAWKATKPTGTHTGTLKVYAGELKLKDKKLSGGYVMINMQTLSVTDLASSEKEKLEANLKGDNFFDTGRFTVARFDIITVNYVSATDTTHLAIEGNLNMHGITKKINFQAAVLKNTDELFITRADIAINRRDWNIATANFKYNTFINPTITLHIVLKASQIVS